MLHISVTLKFRLALEWNFKRIICENAGIPNINTRHTNLESIAYIKEKFRIIMLRYWQLKKLCSVNSLADNWIWQSCIITNSIKSVVKYILIIWFRIVFFLIKYASENESYFCDLKRITKRTQFQADIKINMAKKNWIP